MKSDGNNRGFSNAFVTAFLVIVLIGISLLFANIIAHNNRKLEASSAAQKASREKEALLNQRAIMPPDISSPMEMPVPMIVQNKLGGKWVIAKGVGWLHKTVVYYPPKVKINDIRVVPDTTGKYPTEMYSLEIFLTHYTDDNEVSGLIRLLPLVDKEVIFIQATPETYGDLIEQAQTNQLERAKAPQ